MVTFSLSSPNFAPSFFGRKLHSLSLVLVCKILGNILMVFLLINNLPSIRYRNCFYFLIFTSVISRPVESTRRLITYCNVSSSARCELICLHFFRVGNVQKFPRISVWDSYRRLGVSHDASEEEIWGSRNFLLQQYAGHERSEESIEAAFEKLLMASFRKRKKTKINLKSRLKKKVEESPPWVQNLLNYVELPPTEVILRRLFLFAFMGGWRIMNSAETGPAFQ